MWNRIFISHKYIYLYIIYEFKNVYTNIEKNYRYRTIQTMGQFERI